MTNEMKMEKELERMIAWESPDKILGNVVVGRSLEEIRLLRIPAHDLFNLNLVMGRYMRKMCIENDLPFEETLLQAIEQYGNYLPHLEALDGVAATYRRMWHKNGPNFPTQHDYARWIMGENSEKEIDAKLREKYATLVRESSIYNQNPQQKALVESDKPLQREGGKR